MSVFRNCILIALFGAGLTSAPSHSRTLRVSQDGFQEFTTIQIALDASQEGDSVLVEPGTYHENLNFGFSHNVVLMGRLGRDVTTIDGSGEEESVIQLRYGQSRATHIQGFTITGGRGSLLQPEFGGALHGGGFFVQNSEPTIRENLVWKNGGETTRWGGDLLRDPGNRSPCSSFSSHHGKRNQGEHDLGQWRRIWIPGLCGSGDYE